MGAPRKPTQLHVVKNTAKKHPERMRERKNEPVPTAGIGPAPKHLDARQRAAWDEIVSICAPGVLTNSDRISLEVATVLLCQWRDDPKEFPTSRLNPLNSLLARFGLTPADRSKVNVPQGNGKNPFGAF